LAGLAATLIPSAKLSCFVGETITNVAIALLIDRVVRAPGVGIGRVLNMRPIVFVGTLSYSLYLWQQPFLYEQSRLALHPVLLGIALVFALATISHYVVERPAQRLRARLERRWFGRRPAAAPPTLYPGPGAAV
jgi:peptidoglycan/LPS O-acetylase OafA/YrhL